MASRLVNVRLDDGRLRKVRKLRESGVSLADVVRDAIDARYQAVAPPRTARSVTAVIRQILDQHPDSADLPARPYDVHDRLAARAAIVGAVKKRRR